MTGLLLRSRNSRVVLARRWARFWVCSVHFVSDSSVSLWVRGWRPWWHLQLWFKPDPIKNTQPWISCQGEGLKSKRVFSSQFCLTAGQCDWRLYPRRGQALWGSSREGKHSLSIAVRWGLLIEDAWSQISDFHWENLISDLRSSLRKLDLRSCGWSKGWPACRMPTMSTAAPPAGLVFFPRCKVLQAS